ncbi:unnamed protein product [Nippostrongylus brasiliensis]|uniref:Integrase catalytic domain-containing protein n=1 Tax=Nippostrongylus brasiliensis TaxID=27835 RepID=A0A0N4YD35_NIPBR|nr:unnamed protein product [Nippostrongylus brasiliensis]
MDNYLTIQTFLQKFHNRIQKAAMEKCLHQNTAATTNSSNTDWTLELWLSTIDDIISQEEKIKEMMSNDIEKKTPQQKPTITRTDLIHSTNSCEYCKGKGHRWHFCQRLATPSARRTFLIDTNRCLNCGCNTHQVAACLSGNCRNCNGRHHTATCTKTTEQVQSKDSRAATDPKRTITQPQSRLNKPTTKEIPKRKPTQSSRQLAVTAEAEKPLEVETTVLQTYEQQPSSTTPRNKVVLLVGSAQVFDFNNKKHEAIVLLDTGSELSFISNDFAGKLNLPTVDNKTLSISTFNSQSPTVKKCEIAELQLCDVEGRHHNLRLHKTDYIMDTIQQAELKQEDLSFINLHDIALSLQPKPSKIQPQILLGCDYLWDLMWPIGKLILPSGLQLIPTKLGYIISGCQSEITSEPTKTFSVVTSNEEKEMWDRYWRLESSGTNEFTGSLQSEREKVNQEILQNFRNTIEKRHDGYYVRLPWKENCTSLPDNKSIAWKRLHSVLKAYQHDRATLKQYDDIFKDQLEKGIIEEVSRHDRTEKRIIHYLPHQAVITPNKETTKMRVVFDASAHYKDKPCLNDVLHQGPLILPDMVSILLRFRAHKIAIISDVEKAFLQVHLHEIDRDATRCMWLKDVTLPPTADNIVIYRFTRVTFGLNSSPFLLAATIDFHLDNVISDINMAAQIKENLYVDNLIIGAEASEEALNKYHTVKNIFNGLNMNLREFLSNDKHFNEKINDVDCSKATCPKVLGLRWNSQNDKIILHGTMCPSKIVTKRTVTMQLASVFDPLGFMVPILLPAKIFLQSLWKDEYRWDTPLSQDLQQQWRIISSEISTFYKEIDRRVLQRNQPLTMFVFTDASKLAISACVYIKSSSTTNLVMAKSKLSTLKSATTIPKLEMNAITLGARLAHFVYSSLKELTHIHQILLFSDSEIALAWIKTPPSCKTAGVLVTNRLREIRTIIRDLQDRGVNCLFGHITTNENPADYGTRGCNITSNDVWWRGPQFIHNDITKTQEYQNMFPITMHNDEEDEETACHVAVTSLSTQKEKELDSRTTFDLSRFSSLFKAQRVVSFVFRFLQRTLQNLTPDRRIAILSNIPALQTTLKSCELSGPELLEAKMAIIRDHQRTIVDDHHIKSQKDLNIQYDENGVLRCYGRLKHASIPTSAKTPIFVAAKTALARLLILEAHNQYHQGVAHTMSTIREKYWIPKLRQQVSQILRRCIPCQRFNNLPYRYPETKDLPKRRVQQTRPFEHIGLDYFGPFHVTNKADKVYGCILTCATTRLIHLELVEDMTTQMFLNALRRFFARRGVPKTITCDNAPTFLLGEKVLHETMKQMLEGTDTINAIARKEIAWIHITPYAPWQGGFYERLIRSIKQSLYKTLGQRKVSFDVLRTMFTEIEAVINSRPLTHQEEKWDQEPIIRPIDFIQQGIILDLPLDHDDSASSDPTYHSPEEAQQLTTQLQVEKALKSSIKLTEEFWHIWRTQYLTSLREHHKRNIDTKRGTTTTPKIGTVVILSEPDQPRNNWAIGRITNLVHDEENTVREVTIELPNKRKVRRPVNRVIPLEIGPDTNTISHSSEHTGLPPELSSSSPTPSVPYNLRKRKQVNYAEGGNEASESMEIVHINSIRCSTWTPMKRSLPSDNTHPHPRFVHPPYPQPHHHLDSQIRTNLQNCAAQEYQYQDYKDSEERKPTRVMRQVPSLLCMQIHVCPFVDCMCYVESSACSMSETSFVVNHNSTYTTFALWSNWHCMHRTNFRPWQHTSSYVNRFRMEEREEWAQFIRNELRRKAQLVEKTPARPSEELIQHRLKTYGTKCYEAAKVTEEAMNEYVNLMACRDDYYNRRGGALQFYLKLKQLHKEHELHVHELKNNAELFMMSHDWYEILVVADEAQELDRLAFLRSLNEEEVFESSNPEDSSYPQPVKVHRSYERKDVARFTQLQLVRLQTVLDEEKTSVEEAKFMSKTIGKYEAEVLSDLRFAMEDLKGEVTSYIQNTTQQLDDMKKALKSTCRANSTKSSKESTV